MQTKNVYYSEQPDKVIITSNGKFAEVELPVNVTEIENEEGTQYVAETVYRTRTIAAPNLKERVLENYEQWLEKAKETEPQRTELSDVVEALNALTEIVLGGEL